MTDDQAIRYEYRIPWYKRTAVIIAFITVLGTIFVAVINNYYHTPENGGLSKTPTPTITTPVPTSPSNTPTVTGTTQPPSSGTSQPSGTDQINLFDKVDWGIMEVNFIMTDMKNGKSVYKNTMGAAYEYNSINFNVEAKRSFYESTIYKAKFYDSDQIEIFSSFVGFDPSYSQWQTGDRSKGNIELPDISIQKNVNHIKITQFP